MSESVSAGLKTKGNKARGITTVKIDFQNTRIRFGVSVNFIIRFLVLSYYVDREIVLFRYILAVGTQNCLMRSTKMTTSMLWTDRLIVVITDKLKIQKQCLLQNPNSSTI